MSPSPRPFGGTGSDSPGGLKKQQLRKIGLPRRRLSGKLVFPNAKPICSCGRTVRFIRDMETKRLVEKDPALKKDDLIVITGAGGFIGGNLALYFTKKGFTSIRAVDKKPLYEWYLHVPGVENLCLDVSQEDNCQRVCEGAVEVYNLAADMGGMGFIERFRVECLRSILINTHMVEAAYRAGARRYFLFLLRLRLQHRCCSRTRTSAR